jgi:acetoin:2,6-dichlorophenolindophenol oxidoreductase subunit alpha
MTLVGTASSVDDLKDLLARMWRLRAAEEVVAEARRKGDIDGLLHLAIGGEGIAVGVISQLVTGDRVYSAHRPHGHFIACGTSEFELFAELAGREQGLCRGRGGLMHLMAETAVLATGIVGGSLPIALGHALCVEEGAVVVVFFGDGAVQTGSFHETLNMAALWKAQVLFVCENNGWAEFTTRAEHTPVEQVVDYASVYGIASAKADGTDVTTVQSAASKTLAAVRARKGPAILECSVTRLRPHYEGDLRGKSQSHPSDDDPIAVLTRQLLDKGLPAADLDAIGVAAMTFAEEQMTLALEGTFPVPTDEHALVFTSPYR